MFAPSAFGRSIIRSSERLLVLSALVALAACASGNTPGNASVTAPMASADNGHSVEQVSDVLGQRLDGMLSGQHSGTISR
jgi:hypothetical protein